jgi:hypothetical protein
MTWQPELWSYGSNVAEADEAEERHSKPSQREEIQRWFESHPGERITHMDARSLFRCDRLAARVCELRKMGVPIQSGWRELPSGKRVAEYSIT